MIVALDDLLQKLEQPDSPAVDVGGLLGLRIEFTDIHAATPIPAEEFDAGGFTVRLEKVRKESEDWVVALQITQKANSP
jgi:hypothetical protein